MSSLFFATLEPYGSQSHLTESDIKYIESFKSPKRRAEIASWRDLLRRSYSTVADILYHPSGAPYIVGFDGFLSVSHSSTQVAVILSAEPCAIDLESISRNFERVASRYMTPDESELLTTLLLNEQPLLLPILWSAKEVLYKLSPLDGLDLLEDLRVISIENCEIRGRVKGCEGIITMKYQLLEDQVVVYTP